MQFFFIIDAPECQKCKKIGYLFKANTDEAKMAQEDVFFMKFITLVSILVCSFSLPSHKFFKFIFKSNPKNSVLKNFLYGAKLVKRNPLK